MYRCVMYRISEIQKKSSIRCKGSWTFNYNVHCASSWRLRWLAPSFGVCTGDYADQLLAAEKSHLKALLKSRTFWKTVQGMSESPDDIDSVVALSLPAVIKAIEFLDGDADDKYLTLIKEHPTSSELLYRYAEFVADVQGDADKAEVARYLAQQIQNDSKSNILEHDNCGSDDNLSVNKRDRSNSNGSSVDGRRLSPLKSTMSSGSKMFSSKMTNFHHTVAKNVRGYWC